MNLLTRQYDYHVILNVLVMRVVLYLLLDIDECAEDTDECDFHADCENTVGSYECTCIVGFSGNGRNCGKYVN